MNDIKRNVSEILAICELEPEMKNIFVEGWTDKVVIDRFLNKEHLYVVNVYPMDMVGFDEEYMTMTEQKCARLKSCNKEKVVYLASKVEEKVDGCRMLCIIDRDWDTLFSKESNGRYLAYTDYNSMESYLYREEYIQEVVLNIFRIMGNFDVKAFMASVEHICRFLFHLHGLLIPLNAKMVDIDKNLTYDRQTNCCKLDEGKLIVKIIQKNTKNTIPANFPNQIRERMNMLPADIRMEMVGHEMVKVLFYGLRKHKNVSMQEEDFANAYWLCLDSCVLKEEPLFHRILTL